MSLAAEQPRDPLLREASGPDSSQPVNVVRRRLSIDAELFGQIMGVLYALEFGRVEGLVNAIRDDVADIE